VVLAWLRLFWVGRVGDSRHALLFWVGRVGEKELLRTFWVGRVGDSSSDVIIVRVGWVGEKEHVTYILGR